MGIWTSPLSTSSNGWAFSTNAFTMHRIGTDQTIPLFWVKESGTFDFSNNKNYLFKTKIKNIQNLLDNELSVRTLWNTNFQNKSTPSFSNADGFLNYYSKPNSFFQNKTSHFYIASNSLNEQKGILESETIELDWDIIGFSWINNNTTVYSTTTHGTGWNFIENIFTWYYDESSIINPATVRNNTFDISDKYRNINCLYTYVSAQRFNLIFTLNGTGKIKIFLSETPPYNGKDPILFNKFLDGANKILETDENGIKPLISITGGQYVIIVAENIGAVSYVDLIDLKLSPTYHPDNNKQHQIVDINTYSVNIPGATYSAQVGDRSGNFLEGGTVVSVVKSKIGNGYFDKGIWENGVWNSGWRKDETLEELFDIDYGIKIFSDFKWQIRISGLSKRITKFKKGEIVSIGNIVAIDINEERKQLIDAYRIVDICDNISDPNCKLDTNQVNDYNIGYIVIEIETTFPIRRIEKDSQNHRIKITKNIWLSGALFNGYFSGVWNYGLVKGYPFLTELFDTHWKDGFFEGGRINSEYLLKNAQSEFIETFFDDTKLGIETKNEHILKVGDKIKIDKKDKSINSVYDKEATIIKIIDKYKFVTDIDFNIKVDSETGLFYNYITSSLVQNINFKSENISSITSNTSLSSTSVFNYNSWMDVVYDQNIAVNIGKDQNILDPISKRSYAENNLYGYKTDDILSSISEFRNSFSIEKKKYKLGSKYKVYKNYIGDAGLFNEYFNTQNDIENFLLQGWTFSSTSNDNIKFERTLDEGKSNITGQELEITAINSGGVLDIINIPDIRIDNRETQEIEKNRYSKIEFELIENNSTNNTYYLGNDVNKIEKPILNFNNINIITREEQTLINTALPIHENVNLLDTSEKNKSEYFFNKKNLSLNIKGNGQDSSNETNIIIKNIKFVETDMIPFFKYFTNDTINKSIQIPFQGIAPFIDYNNANFTFLDNIKIGLDSVGIVQSFDTISGVGAGVGSTISPNNPSIPSNSATLPKPPSRTNTIVQINWNIRSQTEFGRGSLILNGAYVGGTQFNDNGSISARSNSLLEINIINESNSPSGCSLFIYDNNDALIYQNFGFLSIQDTFQLNNNITSYRLDAVVDGQNIFGGDQFTPVIQ